MRSRSRPVARHLLPRGQGDCAKSENMCGINGIFAYNPSAGTPTDTELLATRDAMRARGPDGAGTWWSGDRRCGIGHRRLAILDLAERALQPMVSADGRYVVTFNGEIYNYPSLRRELEAEGAVFRTTSDTETLLHLFAREGAAMVDRLRGMYAFAIWDNSERRLDLSLRLAGEGASRRWPSIARPRAGGTRWFLSVR